MAQSAVNASTPFVIVCPIHRLPLVMADGWSVCPRDCRYPIIAPGVVDLLGDRAIQTADHYSLQWGPGVDFASFYKNNRPQLNAMTSRQMGWPALIDRIRARARTERVRLFDAACGYGGVFMDLFEAPAPEGLTYVGADIHGALPSIRRLEGAEPHRAAFVRWDISDPLPVDAEFDVIICRAAIHHTPDPSRTFRSLVERLAPGGIIAITAYAKKPPMREASDDALRSRIVPMEAEAALRVAHQFTQLGKDLQASDAVIEITTDLPFLEIKAGRYRLQEFIYDHFLKCWHNENFGDRYSDIVNFDWYHPPFAYRYDLDDLKAWFRDSGIDITDIQTTKAQHYVEGRRPQAAK